MSLGNLIAIENQDVVGSEWFEDAESEASWADGKSLQDIESFSIIGDHDMKNIDLIAELQEKNRTLEHMLKESEKRCQNLKSESERLKLDLANEQVKSSKYQKKLKYIQDNQEIFNRLKQTYMNMKYNESAGRTMIEIREKCTQTWEGIYCKACILSAEARNRMQLEELCEFTSENSSKVVPVKKDALSKIEDTVKNLREMIDKREKSWSYNADRENRLKIHIEALEKENLRLKERLRNQTKSTEKNKTTTEEIAPDAGGKDTGALKKIICKLEKRNREIDRIGIFPKFPSLLNERENEVVQQIMAKYYRRLQKRILQPRSVSCDRVYGQQKPLQQTIPMPNSARLDETRNTFALQSCGDTCANPVEEKDLIDFSEDFEQEISQA